MLADAGLVVADEVGRERHYRVRTQGLVPVAELLAALRTGPVAPPGRPPVTPAMLDALDLEVRRVGRDRRADDQAVDHPHAGTHHPHTDTGETA